MKARVVAVTALALMGLTLALPTSGEASPLPQDRPQTAPGLTGRVIVKYKDGSTEKANSTERKRSLNKAGMKRGNAKVVEKRQLANAAVLIETTADPTALATELATQPEVEYAVAERKMVKAANDTYWTSQWNLQTSSTGINLEPAWARATGAGVKVAVLDTGSTAHPDLAGQFAGGYDFVSDVTTAGDGNGRDSNPSDPGDFCTATGESSSWHGTGVAGIIGALSNNSQGIAGVAPGAKIVPLRVLGRCGGDESDVIDAIIWASGGIVTGVPANANVAKVINLSLTYNTVGACSPAMQSAVSAARSRGSVVVTASGNWGGGANEYAPGNCVGSVNVAATDRNGAITSYSNTGSSVTLSAPGGASASTGIWSTSLANTGAPGTAPSWNYRQLVGTSFAAPHVAGVAALILSLGTRTPADVESILRSTARPMSTCPAGCGAGLLDALAAVNFAAGAITVGPTVIPLSGGATLNFKSSNMTGVTAINIGGLAATNRVLVNNSLMTAKAPAHKAPGYYPAIVTRNSTNVNAGTIFYVGAPTVGALSSTSATAGTVITVTGTGFVAGVTSVDFHGIAASGVQVTSWTSLRVTVPAGTAGRKALVHVKTPMGTSSGSKGSTFTWK